MYAKVLSMTICGIDGLPVTVEVDVSSGLPDFSLVGDLSPETREARERVRTSLRNSGFSFPSKRITINLAPGDLRKEGTGFDLAIAVGMLAAYEEIEPKSFEGIVMLGELSLDGRICSIPGVLPMVIAAQQLGYSACFVPQANAAEAAVVAGMKVTGVETLAEVCAILKGLVQKDPAHPASSVIDELYDVDFSEVNGQKSMRRAAEVAAAGMHNILLIGSPGAGKTMIARRLPTILPDLTWNESLEVTRIYSVSGLVDPNNPVKRQRPFRTPHHTISAPALIGGGKRPMPGEVSLADRGILFLDELPEFQKSSLEALRQPLEDKLVSVVRVTGRSVFPADFMLCAAMNPCRCGYYPDRDKCHCSEGEVRKYMQRISRPLLDRIDITVEAPPVKYSDLDSEEVNESSADIKARVKKAWEIQQKRYEGQKTLFNSQMSARQIKKWCRLTPSDEKLMADVYAKMNLSARGYHKILKVSRTIADLAGSEDICTEHLMEALSYRSVDKKFWG